MTRARCLSLITQGACLLGLMGMIILLSVHALQWADQRQQKRLIQPYQREEQIRDDIAREELRLALKWHVMAVRSDAASRPDDELAKAIVDYAVAGKTFWRTHKKDPTSQLADLREAMDGLRPLQTPRIACPQHRISTDPQACDAYFKAIKSLFPGGLDG